MATGKELVPYSRLEAIGSTIRGYGKKIVKKVPTEYTLLGKAGKQIAKGISFAARHPITTAVAATAGYLAGGASRRYEQAPKMGEDRDLTSKQFWSGLD